MPKHGGAIASLALLATILSGAVACRPKATLASVTMGTAYLSSRTTMSGVGTFDEPILPGPKGLISFRIDPPSQAPSDCIPALDGGKLEAEANGKPMKLESAGGSHDEYPMGPDHFPRKQRVCDPIRFTLEREKIQPDDQGIVKLVVTDGSSSVELAFGRPFDPRMLTLGDHPPRLKPGEHVSFAWNPTHDDLTHAGPVQACLKPSAEPNRCPSSLNGSQCTSARLVGGAVDLDVPASWSCTTKGSVWVSGMYPRAENVACDARLKDCRADLAAGVEPLDVEIIP